MPLPLPTMPLRRTADRAFEIPWVYRMLQAPFAERKLAPFLRDVDVGPDRSILDIGCGPGTNAMHFQRANYTGIDINSEYVAYAGRRFRGRFIVGDVTDPAVLPDERFDGVLLNSLLHHLDDDAVRSLLARLPRLVSAGGHIYILDLVLPLRLGAARRFAQLDRGHFARPAAQWRALFDEAFAVEVFEEFALGISGLTLWEMCYCRGTPR